jgi:threonine-phosphate decarboxylase
MSSTKKTYDYNELINSKKYEHGGNLFNSAKGGNQNAHDILNIFNEAKKKIDFSANINPLGLSKNALCILKNIKLVKFLIENYPEVYPERLTDKLSDYHHVQSNNIIIGNGATNLVYKILSILKPENVLIAEPSFSEYERACSVLGINTLHQCTFLKDGFKLINNTLAEFIDKIKNLNERDFIFIASPSNPAGIITPLNTIREILKICKKKNLYLILDESFMDFKEECSSKYLIEEFENLIVLRSMTKFFAIPGERVGYILSCKKNISKITKTVAPWRIGGLASALAVASLSDKEYITDSVKYINKSKEEMFNAIIKFKTFEIIRGEANFLLIRIKSAEHHECESIPATAFTPAASSAFTTASASAPACSALNIKDYLFDKGILVRYAGNYRCLDDSFFRIAVKKRKENKILANELKKYIIKLKD